MTGRGGRCSWNPHGTGAFSSTGPQPNPGEGAGCLGGQHGPQGGGGWFGIKYGWHTDIQWFCGMTAFRYSGITLSNRVLGIGLPLRRAFPAWLAGHVVYSVVEFGDVVVASQGGVHLEHRNPVLEVVLADVALVLHFVVKFGKVVP